MFPKFACNDWIVCFIENSCLKLRIKSDSYKLFIYTLDCLLDWFCLLLQSSVMGNEIMDRWIITEIPWEVYNNKNILSHNLGTAEHSSDHLTAGKQQFRININKIRKKIKQNQELALSKTSSHEAWFSAYFSLLPMQEFYWVPMLIEPWKLI